MSYRLLKDEHPGKGISRVICEQIDKAVDRLRRYGQPDADAVHRTRVGCKKIRAALRLARFSLGDRYSIENAWFRDAASKLAPLRDARVMIRTLDRLQTHSGQAMEHDNFVWVRQRLEGFFDDVVETVDAEKRITEVIEDLEQGRARVLSYDCPADDFDALRSGLEKTLKRAAKAYRASLKDPSAKAMHEWRKRIKYHLYQARLLRNIWPKVLKGYCRSLKDLADILGENHDLDVFGQHLAEQEQALGTDARMDQLKAMVDRSQKSLRQQAFALGARIHAEKPKRWCKRSGRYWDAWQQDA